MSVLKPEVKSLIKVHTALLWGQILLLILVSFLAKDRLGMASDFFKTLQTIDVFLTVILVGCGIYLFRKRMVGLKEIFNLQGFSKGFLLYKKATNFKFLLLEIATLLNLVAYFLSANVSFLLLGCVLVILFAAQRPTIPLLMFHSGLGKEPFFLDQEKS